MIRTYRVIDGRGRGKVPGKKRKRDGNNRKEGLGKGKIGEVIWGGYGPKQKNTMLSHDVL